MPAYAAAAGVGPIGMRQLVMGIVANMQSVKVMPWLFQHLSHSALTRLCQLQLSPMSFGLNLKGRLCVVCASRSPYHQALQALTVKPILRRFPHAPVLALTHTLQLTNPGHGMLQYTQLTPKTHTHISLLSSSNGLTGVQTFLVHPQSMSAMV